MLLASKHLETRSEETVGAEDTKRGLTDVHLKEQFEEEWGRDGRGDYGAGKR